MRSASHIPLREHTNSNFRDHHGAVRQSAYPQKFGYERFAETPKTRQRYAESTPKTQGGTIPHRGQPATPGHRIGGSYGSPMQMTTPQKALFQRYLLRDIPQGEQEPTLTVILDLDETLVSNRRADLPQAILRPYVMDILAAMRALPGVEIVMWTASTEETGSAVARQLHAEGVIFDEIIYRNDKWFTEPVHTKDLRLLGRDMGRVVVFDNAPNCCKLNRNNAVLIEDFMGAINPNDHSLVNMLHTVQTLVNGIAGENKTVPQILGEIAKEEELAYTTNYPVPENWAHVNPRDVSPLMYPACGAFHKLRSTTSQRHTFRV